MTAADIAKGFVKPLRGGYRHTACDSISRMDLPLAETYARNPRRYGGAFCQKCRKFFKVAEFTWLPDGESMDPTKQGMTDDDNH